MAIDDFGEKIGGAKKDLWKERNMILSDLSEMNAEEKLKLIKKDAVWKKPDYAALVEDGLPIKVAWFVKTVRDSLAAKPVLTYFDSTPDAVLDKQEKYVKFVGAVRDAVMNCKSEADILAIGNRNWLAECGYIESGNSYYVRPTSAAGEVITNKFLKAFCVNSYNLSRYDREIERKQFLFNDEQKLLANYEFYKYENVTWNKDYNDRPCMNIKYSYGTHYFYPKGEFADEGSWVPDSYFVVSKSGHNIVARNFDALDEAKKFVIDKDSGKEAEKPKRKGKTRFVPSQLAHIKRDGDDVRHGRSMTGQDYLDVFEFKGGEFGNWMSEKDRQASLNLGYEALYDLAKALKVDFKDISFGNSLSIAFGARGSGSALAHYESMREVINLTKMRGAGSLAHEWGHALDDILGKRLGISGFMTKNLWNDKVPQSLKTLVDKMEYKEVLNSDAVARQQKDVDLYSNKLRRVIDGYFPVNDMSSEQLDRKDALVQAYIDSARSLGLDYFDYIRTGEGNAQIDALSDFRKEVTGRVIPKEDRINLAHYQNSLKSKLEYVNKPERVSTDFYNNSLLFDKQYSKTDHGYWHSREEMFARAFACYVMDKVEGRSDYLCGHANMAVSMIHLPGTEEGKLSGVKAYPVGEERKVINQCFDEFIQELKDMDLLHHKEDFNIEKPNERVRDVEAEWGRMPETEAEAYPLTLFDILAEAEERSKKVDDSNDRVDELEFDRGF